jgi:hypothetical protein
MRIGCELAVNWLMRLGCEPGREPALSGGRRLPGRVDGRGRVLRRRRGPGRLLLGPGGRAGDMIRSRQSIIYNPYIQDRVSGQYIYIRPFFLLKVERRNENRQDVAKIASVGPGHMYVGSSLGVCYAFGLIWFRAIYFD